MFSFDYSLKDEIVL